MWSEDIFSAYMDMYGTIPAGANQGAVTQRNVTFYREVLLIGLQASLSWDGAVPVVEYHWEITTNIQVTQGSVTSILPAAAPFDDKWWKAAAYSHGPNYFKLNDSVPANFGLQFSGSLYAENAPAIQMAANINVQLFYKVNRF